MFLERKFIQPIAFEVDTAKTHVVSRPKTKQLLFSLKVHTFNISIVCLVEAI